LVGAIRATPAFLLPIARGTRLLVLSEVFTRRRSFRFKADFHGIGLLDERIDDGRRSGHLERLHLLIGLEFVQKFHVRLAWNAHQLGQIEVDVGLLDVRRQRPGDPVPETIDIHDLPAIDGLDRVLLIQLRSVKPDGALADTLDLDQAVHPAVRATTDQVLLLGVERHFGVLDPCDAPAERAQTGVVRPRDPLAITLHTIPAALDPAHLP